MVFLVTINLYEKRLERNYEVTFIHGKLTRLTTRNYILFGVCDEGSIQKFVMRLKVVLHVPQQV